MFFLNIVDYFTFHLTNKSQNVLVGILIRLSKQIK